MAIYQKGDLIVDEAKVGTKTAEDWAAQGFTPKLPASNLNLPSITGPTTPVDQGTDNLRGNLSGLDFLGQETQKLLEEKASSPDLSASLATLTAQRNAINSYSQQDLSAIEEAGRAAGLEYDPLITEAEKAKRFGMPKATVAAGERGGFMNTQFSGAAALVPTEGGSWVGAGGELERIKSVYDDNISKLQANKQQAIAQAKIAARQAIRTGKQDDFNTAKSLYELARQSHQDTIDLQAKKLNALNNYSQEKRAETTSSYNIMKDIPLGQSVTINGETFEGIAVPDAEKAFFTGSNIIELMKSLPEGTSEVIKDPNTGIEYTIMGLSKEKPDYYQATDDKGNVTFIDKTTLEPVRKVMGIGKTKTQAANVTLNLTQGQSEAISAAASRLNTSKGIKKPDNSGDTFWNTDVYIDERNKYGATPGADTKDFDLQYSWNLNPTDPNANRILNSIGQAPKKKSASEVIGEALGNVNFND